MAGPKLFTGGTLTIRAGSVKEIVLPLGEMRMEPVMGDSITLRGGPVGTLADALSARGSFAGPRSGYAAELERLRERPHPPTEEEVKALADREVAGWSSWVTMGPVPRTDPEPPPPQRTVRVRYTGETVVSVPAEWDESMILAAVRGAFLADAEMAGRVVEVVEEWPEDEGEALALTEHDLAAGNERAAADEEAAPAEPPRYEPKPIKGATIEYVWIDEPGEEAPPPPEEAP
jgi:hypothetical protein